MRFKKIIKRGLSRHKGLTLIELLVTVGIVTVIAGLLLVTITNTTGIFYKETSRVQSGLNSNEALSNIRETIKVSSAVVESYTSGSTTYSSSPSQLVLKVPSVDSSNNIIKSVFDYFVFYLDRNILRLKSFPDVQSTRKAQDRIFSTFVDSLLFQYLDSNTPPTEVTPATAVKIRITLTLKQKSGATFETNIATSEGNIRND